MNEVETDNNKFCCFGTYQEDFARCYEKYCPFSRECEVRTRNRKAFKKIKEKINEENK